MNAITENTQLATSSADLLPLIEPTPEALMADEDRHSHYESDDDDLFAGKMKFFDYPVVQRFHQRPYHQVDVEGPFHLKKLLQDYAGKVFRSSQRINHSKQSKFERLLLQLSDTVSAILCHDTLSIYAPTLEAANQTAEQFRCYVKPVGGGGGKPHFYIVSLSERYPQTVPVLIERLAPVSDADVALNYGADFLEWERGWLKQMSRSPSGLSIFLGQPGTGKTTYTRSLITRLLNRAVFFFIPVSASEILASPQFVDFWIEQTSKHGNKRKIAVMEDAEELLLPRDRGSRDKVSNLLNIADGFLGDYLKLHVLLTSNAELHQMDQALLRPGRLTGSREFRRLKRPEAERIAEAKGFELTLNQPDYSLAEIYCGAADVPELDSKRVVGFAP